MILYCMPSIFPILIPHLVEHSTLQCFLFRLTTVWIFSDVLSSVLDSNFNKDLMKFSVSFSDLPNCVTSASSNMTGGEETVDSAVGIESELNGGFDGVGDLNGSGEFVSVSIMPTLLFLLMVISVSLVFTIGRTRLLTCVMMSIGTSKLWFSTIVSSVVIVNGVFPFFYSRCLFYFFFPQEMLPNIEK